GLAESGRGYRPAELAPAQELAYHAALMVENARLRAAAQRSEARSARQAATDPLTGLLNRTAFMERLEEALTPARADGSAVAALFFGLDRFKVVNSGLGHAAGDLLLIAVAERLSRAIAPRGMIARFGGDEFLALIGSVRGEQDVLAVAETLLGALNEPFMV